MEPTVEPQLQYNLPEHLAAWEMVAGQLRSEMDRASYETWIQPLRPLGFKKGIYTLGAYNPYGRDWVVNRLGGRITRLLEGYFRSSVDLQVVINNTYYQGEDGNVVPPPDPLPNQEERSALGGWQVVAASLPPSAANAPVESIPPSDASSAEAPNPTAPAPATSRRKVMLQRAYGSERARVIQPERGMFVTLYFFYNWVPLIGHSAAAVILAARSLCYWNPVTGDLRNVIETDMSELAKRASVSVRTVKDVLNNEWVQRFFIRYKVRRMMTPNGVRTAGIALQVRMDDPLTPEDQEKIHVSEDEWYLPEFSGPEEKD
jgi:hypothetical protein